MTLNTRPYSKLRVPPSSSLHLNIVHIIEAFSKDHTQSHSQVTPNYYNYYITITMNFMIFIMVLTLHPSYTFIRSGDNSNHLHTALDLDLLFLIQIQSPVTGSSFLNTVPNTNRMTTSMDTHISLAFLTSTSLKTTGWQMDHSLAGIYPLGVDLFWRKLLHITTMLFPWFFLNEALQHSLNCSWRLSRLILVWSD